MSAAPGARSRMLHPRYAKQTSSTRPSRMPNNPIASHALQQHIEIIGGALAQIPAMRREERFCGSAPGVTKHAQEVPFGVELGRRAEVDHQVARYAVNAHACPEGALSIARVADLPQQRNHAQFLQQNCIEETSLRRLRISRAVFGVPARSTG